MSIPSVFATLSTVLAIYCVYPYLRAVFNGKTKPHQLSWLVFSIVNFVSFLSQFLEGARSSVIISFIFTLGSLSIFLLSFKYGVRETSRWDWLLFTLAILTIFIWIATGSNATAIWLTILIDIPATAMTVLKIRAQPNSEDPTSWVIGSVAYLFAVLSLASPLGLLYIRPLYGILSEGVVALTIFTSRRTKKAVVTTSPLEN